MIRLPALAAVLATLLSLFAPAAAAQPHTTLVDLVDAATRRLQVAEPIAANKFHTGGLIEDPAREAQVLDAVSSEAAALQIDPAYVASVFRDQIDATVAIEYTRLAQWKFDPAAAPVDVPDLTSSRGVVDALNREMVTRMADEWDKLHAPTCRPELDQAKATVAAQRGLDPLYRQALDHATRSYCR